MTENNIYDFKVWGIEVVSCILLWESLSNSIIIDIHGSPYSEVRECLNTIRGAVNNPFLSFTNFKSTGLYIYIRLPPVTTV